MQRTGVISAIIIGGCPEAGNDLERLYAAIDQSTARIRAFLEEQGVAGADITSP